MLNPNCNSMPNAGNLTSEASVGQNDPVTDLIENAQSLGRFYMLVCQFYIYSA